MQKKTYFVEVTDTFGGEANYCWVHRYMVTASSQRGAIGKVARHEGLSFRADYAGRYNAIGGCVCAFVSYSEGEEKQQYSNIVTL